MTVYVVVYVSERVVGCEVFRSRIDAVTYMHHQTDGWIVLEVLAREVVE